jgi:hypothetical protein
MNAPGTLRTAIFAVKSRTGRTGRTGGHPSLLYWYFSINFAYLMRQLRLSSWCYRDFGVDGASTLGPGASTRTISSLGEITR